MDAYAKPAGTAGTDNLAPEGNQFQAKRPATKSFTAARPLLCGHWLDRRRSARRYLCFLGMRGRLTSHVDLVAASHEDEHAERRKRDETDDYFPHLNSPFATDVDMAQRYRLKILRAF